MRACVVFSAGDNWVLYMGGSKGVTREWGTRESRSVADIDIGRPRVGLRVRGGVEDFSPRNFGCSPPIMSARLTTPIDQGRGENGACFFIASRFGDMLLAYKCYTMFYSTPFVIGLSAGVGLTTCSGKLPESDLCTASNENMFSFYSCRTIVVMLITYLWKHNYVCLTVSLVILLRYILEL